MLEIMLFLSALPCVACFVGWIFTGGIGWVMAAAVLLVPHYMLMSEVMPE